MTPTKSPSRPLPRPPPTPTPVAPPRPPPCISIRVSALGMALHFLDRGGGSTGVHVYGGTQGEVSVGSHPSSRSMVGGSASATSLAHDGMGVVGGGVQYMYM